MRRRSRTTVYLVLGCLSLGFLFYLLLIRRIESDAGPLAGGLRQIVRPIIEPNINQRLQDIEAGVVSSKQAIQGVRDRLLQTSRKHKNRPDQDDYSRSSFQSDSCSFDSLPSDPAVLSVHDIYSKIPFDNPDGGVWKQGWEIEINQTRRHGKKLQVFVVPHSHNDPGWLKTFEGYFRGHTKHILDNMLKFLPEHPSMKFIWAETSYFAFWWDTISSEEDKNTVRQLLSSGQLEIVTGGWVMNDEANTHIFAMITQLMEGHEWLKKHVNYTPRHGWAIDPFGLSPSMAFLLERSGFDGMVIQRVHYSIKKYLAKNHLLEFKWRQNWQTKIPSSSLNQVIPHKTRPHDEGISCHVLPFYSYDIPHSCGPDPKVCCQFDFRRLPPFKLSCPWKINPSSINRFNVEGKARELANQYWKKAMLFKTNAVLIPLGDDFRFEKLKEWELQYDNYQKLFDFMNSTPDLNIEAKFGTLSDYFDYIREEQEMNTGASLPSLTGDFFTYSDRDDQYWSGYYTSRPFYKKFDRLLDSLLRSTDILFSIAFIEKLPISSVPDTRQKLEYIRQSLSLFQHHDAITGTAREVVVNDYARRIHRSLAFSHGLMEDILLQMFNNRSQQSISRLYSSLFLEDKDSLPRKQLLPIDDPVEDGQLHHGGLILFNSLTHARPNELICMESTLNTSGVSVTDSIGTSFPTQISYIWNGIEIITDRIETCFVSELKPLSLKSFTVEGKTSTDGDAFSHVSLYNFDSFKVPENEYVSKVSETQEILVESDILRIIIDSTTGFIKRVIQVDEFGLSQTHEFKLDFVTYGTVSGKKDTTKSGAYLFMPGMYSHVSYAINL